MLQHTPFANEARQLFVPIFRIKELSRSLDARAAADHLLLIRRNVRGVHNRNSDQLKCVAPLRDFLRDPRVRFKPLPKP